MAKWAEHITVVAQNEVHTDVVAENWVLGSGVVCVGKVVKNKEVYLCSDGKCMMVKCA